MPGSCHLYVWAVAELVVQERHGMTPMRQDDGGGLRNQRPIYHSQGNRFPVGGGARDHLHKSVSILPQTNVSLSPRNSHFGDLANVLLFLECGMFSGRLRIKDLHQSRRTNSMGSLQSDRPSS